MKKCLSLLLCMLLLLSFPMMAFAEEADVEDEYVEEEYTEEEETVELLICMDVSVEDGEIVVDLVDDQGGTISSWPVYLEVDGVRVDTVTTDEYGTAVFDYPIPDGTQEIACTAKDGYYEHYHFVGCTVYVEYSSNDDSGDEDYAPTDDEEYTEPSQTTTSVAIATTTTPEKKPANSTPMTTTLSGDRVAIGVSVDNALLIASQSTQSEYHSDARMWMSNTVYRSLVNGSKSSLQLQLTLNEQAGALDRLVAAKNANAVYAGYTDDSVKGFAMDLQIAYVDEYTTVPLEIEDGTYTIEMPLPSLLRSSEKIAVAVCTADGLSTLIEVVPANGMINFTVQRFQTLAIVGFGTAANSFEALTKTPWLLVVMVIIGVLMIAGGIVLLITVAFRRKKAVVKRDEDKLSEEPKRVVSLDAAEDDDVFVAPIAAPKTEPTTPTVKESHAVQAPVAAKPTVKADTAEELDDLLDEILNDLDS